MKMIVGYPALTEITRLYQAQALVDISESLTGNCF